ncbi:MAG: OprD family outer membrane porin [Gammaproteobacteria bacterium]
MQADQEESNHNFAVKLCGGYARTGYIETDVDGSSTESAIALGGEFACNMALSDKINLSIGGSTSIEPGLINSDNAAKLHGDFFDADKDSYIFLSEAVLNANLGKLNAHLGRQIFDSPHMDSDDLRIVPNRFEAYQLNYNLNDNADFGFSYVRKMSGWENGGDQSRFIDVGQALGADEGDAFVVWSSYEQSGLAIQLWNYLIEDIENIFYAEAIYATEYNDNISWEIGLQYDQGRDIGAAKLGNVDADTWGVTAALNYKLITISAAHNRNHGDSGALASLGGGPFFSSMEDQTLDAVNDSNARSTTLGVEIETLKNLVLGFVAGDFRADNKSNYHIQENNVYLNYSWDDKVILEAIYADINNRNLTTDADQLRVILTYQFDGPY